MFDKEEYELGRCLWSSLLKSNLVNYPKSSCLLHMQPSRLQSTLLPNFIG